MSVWMKTPGLYFGAVSPHGGQCAKICDRCGQIREGSDLQWQFDWQGTQLINLRRLVCSKCYDTPNQQFRAMVLPPDPVPVQDPRTRYTRQYNTNYITDTDGNFIQNTDNEDITNSPIPD